MPQYIIGIDLGTTNSALASAAADSETEQPDVELFPVAQLTDPGEVSPLDLLPASSASSAAPSTAPPSSG